ncbi:RNA-binding protein 48 [Leguminivora glycinivorella]|uniref:RNA-binding protein 48 n=1 Tax=Leguminivora glycinivorella TaxID=1035111 RepID=UPI00200DD253|nr:RNA-binding protein 48 [Leguminivora glycinivorella]
MSEENSDNKVILPHHEQQQLCTTRLPYRQGRKLTAVKVYTINSESNHLLIFGVPSLNLRQEAKALFQKFGRLKSFTLAKDYKSEQFTETCHAVFEKIQSARVAKRMLDTKNFYGGSLHITYAPELEDVDETRIKLLQRKHDVLTRLKNLQNEEVYIEKKVETQPEVEQIVPKLNMGETNVISLDGSVRKRKLKGHVEEKRFKPCFITNEVKDVSKSTVNFVETLPIVTVEKPHRFDIVDNNIDIVDCTSTDVETITNVNEHDNIKEGVKIFKIPEKPLNKIKFNVNKKS